jgi:hypothetical protein
MTNRFVRLVSFLVLLVVLAAGGSLASSQSAFAVDGAQRSSALCLNDQALPGRGARHGNYSPIRVAQIHCHCCGWDENKHCNHQCC